VSFIENPLVGAWVELGKKDADFLKLLDGPAASAGRVVYSLRSRDEFGRELSEEGERAVRDIMELQGLWSVRAMKMFFTPLQIAKKIKLEPVRRYLEEVEKWWNTRVTIIVRPSQIVEDWRGLGKEEGEKLARALFEISERSDELDRPLTGEEERAFLDEFGVFGKSREVYYRVKSSLAETLDRLERGLIRNAIYESVEDNPEAAVEAYERAAREGEESLQTFFEGVADGVSLQMRIGGIKKDFERLRRRNYFPRERFGKYTLAGIAKGDTEVEGKKFTRGQLAYFATFENVTDQHLALTRLGKEYPNLLWKDGKLTDTEISLLGLPPGLMEDISLHLKLSDQQKEALKEIWLRRSPGRSFLRHLTRRKGIPGYSKDAMRAYSAYMLNAAGHLARVEHHLPLTMELKKISTLAKLKDPGKVQLKEELVKGEEGEKEKEKRRESADLMVPLGKGTVLGEIRDYFLRHYEYIMSPARDWAQLRAVGFLWYLGLNPRSAAVNLTQVPMVTYPWLAARFGDGAAVRSILAAYREVVRTFKDPEKVRDPKLLAAIERGMRDGYLDESIAVDLAAISDAPALLRALPGETGSGLINGVSYYGSWLFHKAETFNRRVTFHAAWRLAQQRGLDEEMSYQLAKDAVQSTQFEYAKWNRAAFMRGKKSVIFLFKNYTQQAAYLAFGGEGKGTALRFWAVLLFAAGLQGLPFSEDLMALLDALLTQAKEKGGSGDPRTKIEEDLRQLAVEIGANPDLVMHGFGRYYGLGPLHMAAVFGVPVPYTDISASLGLGRITPGLLDVTSPGREQEKRLVRTMVEMGGPVMAMGYNLWRLGFEDSPDEWKKWERALPAVLKNVSMSLRYWARGKETLDRGATLVSWEDRETRAGVVAARALGFGPTSVARAYERKQAQYEAGLYYLTRRTLLLQDLGWASVRGEKEGAKEVLRRIREYNRNVKDKRLRISAQEIRQSLRQKKRRIVQEERGLPNERRLRRVYARIGRAY